jgi:hypothetical protein
MPSITLSPRYPEFPWAPPNWEFDAEGYPHDPLELDMHRSYQHLAQATVQSFVILHQALAAPPPNN